MTSKGLRQGVGWGTPTRRPCDGHAHTPAGPSPRSGGQWICCCPRSEVRTPGEVPRPGSHVWASESSSRPPFPSRYLAKSFLVTSPTTCGNKARSWESSGPTPPLGKHVGEQHSFGETWKWAYGQSGSWALESLAEAESNSAAVARAGQSGRRGALCPPWLLT